jgi:putative aldouronate transport system substrate-binding protein
VWTVPTTVNQYGQVLVDKADALIAQAITARPADFDRIWDAGLADFMASGGQEVLNDRGRVYPAR